MSTYDRGEAVIVGPDEGDSYWQPLPSTGYVINKLTPYNTPYDDFSAGMQVLEPGCAIREHGHERSHEILFVAEGTGHAIVDGQRHELAPGATLLLGRSVLHFVQNSNDGPMRLFWVIFPSGLEDWFAAIGRARQPGESEAPVFDRPDNVREIQERMRFVRPDDERARERPR